jgi:hypothetical protein
MDSIFVAMYKAAALESSTHLLEGIYFRRVPMGERRST